MLKKLHGLRRLSGVVSLLESLCCGTLAAALMLIWFSLSGTSSAAIISLVTAVTIAGAFNAMLQTFFADLLQKPGIRIVTRILSLMIIPVSLPVAATLLNETLELTTGTQSVFSTIAVIFVLLPPALVLCACLAPVALLMSEEQRHSRVFSLFSFTCGLSGPLIVTSMGLSTYPGTAGLCLLVAIPSGLFCLGHTESMKSKTAADSGIRFRSGTAATLYLLCCGILFVALFQISQYLVAADPLTNLIGLSLAMAAAMTCSRCAYRTIPAGIVMLLLCGALLVMVRSFDSLSMMLLSGRSAGNGFSVLLSRIITIATVLFPAAAAFGLFLRTPSVCNACIAPVLTTGVLSGLMLLSAGLSPWQLIAAFPLLIIPYLVSGFQRIISRGSLRTAAAFALTGLLSLSIVILPAPDTASSTRVAFSARTHLAAARGFTPALLTVTDPARLIRSVTANLAQYSVWNQSGHIREFRTNGQSPAYLSLSPDISPQPAQEILPVITALCNHPLASQIIIAGDDSGAGLRTATAFPVRSITAIRTDKALTSLVTAECRSAGQESPFEDERVRLIHAPPTMALRSLPRNTFDAAVINVGPDFPSRLSEYLSSESCRLLDNALKDDGVLVFRFHSSRSGAETIRRAIGTLQTVFDQAGAIQLTPDETLFLASNHEGGLISPQFFSNLQKQHVRAQLNSAGWDWASISVLALLDANDPIGIFSENPVPTAISCSEPWMLTGYPLERIAARDLKLELRRELAPHQMQVASAVSVGDDHREAQRRLASLAQQREILAGLPDQPWTYRKSLRMEMQRSPRPPLEEFSDGRIQQRTHPLDQLRQDYFIQLGKALNSVRSGDPAMRDSIHRLAKYAASGEPLLSHFAHYEIVRLYELAGHPDPADELQHRLHLAFAAEETDASVRTTIAALEQLNQQPQLLAQQTVRFDQMNSLLQELIERWEARTRWDPVSADRVQADIDESVRVCQQALDHLELLSAELKLDEDRMQLRRQYINQALIVPLRNYREQVVRHQTAGTQTPAKADGQLPALVQPSDILSTN